MPWSFKVTIAAFVIFGVGSSLIGFACVEGGWGSLGHFAWGLVIAGAGLIGALIFSIVCAITQLEWRTRSLMTGALAILFFLRSYFLRQNGITERAGVAFVRTPIQADRKYAQKNRLEPSPNCT